MLSRVAALEQAARTSQDRAIGAALTGDAYWRSEQLLAESRFAHHAAVAYSELFMTDRLVERWLDHTFVPGSEQERAELLAGGELPTELVELLKDFGASQEDIAALTRIALLDRDQVADARQLAAARGVQTIATVNAAVGSLAKAISLRTNELGTPVRPINAEQHQHLQERQDAVVATLKSPSGKAMAEVQNYLAEVRETVVEANNLAELQEYLDFGYAAMVLLQQSVMTPAEMATALSRQLADEAVPVDTASAIDAELSAADALVKEGDFAIASQPFVLDVWVDWNADGAFAATEKFQYPSEAFTAGGVNSFVLDVPADAAVAEIDAMIHLSDTGWDSANGDVPNGQTEFVRILLENNPFKNPVIRADVNNSGSVEPFDALLIINALNRAGSLSIELDPRNEDQPKLPAYPDVSGDGGVTPLDALQVINALNRLSRSDQTTEGEKEAAAIAPTQFISVTEALHDAEKSVAVDQTVWIDSSYAAGRLPQPWSDHGRREALEITTERNSRIASFASPRVASQTASITMEKILDGLAGDRTNPAAEREADDQTVDVMFAALGREDEPVKVGWHPN